jgi:hypothetical protein
MHDEVLGLPRDEWERVLDRIARLKDSLRVVVEPTEGFPRDDRFHVCDPFRSAILHVDVQGRLNLCCQHSGVPAPEGHPRTDVAGHLAEMSLPRAHARLLDIVNETMKARLDHLEKASESGAVDGWDRYGCNWCMKHFGKPHWTDRGTAGASAARERWNGAWDEAAQEERKRRRLPLARS